jgi:hypothetical protein
MKIKNQNFTIAIILVILILNSTYILAQELALKASFDGIPVQGFRVEIDGLKSGRLDFNRDGIPDRPFIDSKNETLVILSGSNKQKWIVSLSYSYHKVTFDDIVIGFYEMDGNQSTTEIVIAKKDGDRLIGPTILSVNLENLLISSYSNILSTSGYFLQGISDTDNDGKNAIIIANSTEKRIEIWSY